MLLYFSAPVGNRHGYFSCTRPHFVGEMQFVRLLNAMELRVK